MKKMWKFLRKYKLFGLAIIALIAGMILELTKKYLAAHIVLGGIAVIEVIPLLWGMWNDLRDGSYGIDILAATAIISSVLLHQYLAGMVIVLMLTGGEALEDYAERRAKNELDALLRSAPQRAHLIRNQKTVDVPVAEIKTGNRIIIRPGEVVPVDAKILEGSANFDESSLTGESLPQTKNVGDELLSGSINIDGVIAAQALRPAADSQYEQIIKLVRSASTSQSPFVRLADRYSIPFTIVSFAIAIAVWVISGHAIRFLEVLVVATPCPLILAAPIAVISGMSRAARHGVIIKTGSSLEKLAEAKTIAFDKTGTLTIGKPEVKKITTYNGYKVADVLAVAGSLEQNSNHVLAKAIIEEAKNKHVKLAKAKKVSEIAGIGLSGYVGTKEVFVGRLNFLQEQGIKLPKDFNVNKIQAATTFVAIDYTFAGTITFEDTIRPESKQTLRRLLNTGIKNILMVTGDNLANARVVAKQLGIKQVIADALPVDKLRAIEVITERPVVFVGDGVNDAPVLTASDVGIALGARGSTAASESADIVILLDDVGRVATAREIASRTFFIAKQSILVGIAFSVILMFIFATGKFPPVYGAIVQELVDVVVIFNALRAHGAWVKKRSQRLATSSAT